MKRRIISVFLLSLLLASALSVPAYADSSWWVTFTEGEEMKSNFTSEALAEAVSGMQPRDNNTFQITLTNDNSYVTDWYMTNQVLESLEDYSKNQLTSGGAYTYTLTFNGPGGTRELFSSDTVGGEGTNRAGEGLHQAAASMKDYFYLDTLSKGQTGTVTLTVGLDGETQTNTYQDTRAELAMNFAVLLNYDSPDNPDGQKIIKTGDENNLGMYAGLTAVSGLLVLLLALYGWNSNRKSRKAKKEGGQK